MTCLSDQNTTLRQPAEFSIFTLSDNQVAIQNISYSECRFVSSFQSDETPIELTVPGQGNEYIDVRRSRLYVKCKIVKSHGSPLASQEKIGMINSPLQTLWSETGTYMNATQNWCLLKRVTVLGKYFCLMGMSLRTLSSNHNFSFSMTMYRHFGPTTTSSPSHFGP